MADLLGREESRLIKEECRLKFESLYNKGNRKAKLCVLLVGNDEGSLTYVGSMRKAMQTAGVEFELLHYEESTEEEEVLTKIDELNLNDDVDGIFIQMPLPAHMSSQKVVERIAPHKDVDGLHPFNLGRLMIGKDAFVPCTPNGINHLIKKTGIDLVGKQAVMIGRSMSVGKPMVFLMEKEHMTVTLCHSRTQNMRYYTNQADVLVIAIGKAEFIDDTYVKEGAIVIDVGINRNSEGKLVGDVDYEKVKDKASYITPVPGGVGVMTIAMLLKNILQAYEIHIGERSWYIS